MHLDLKASSFAGIGSGRAALPQAWRRRDWLLILVLVTVGLGLRAWQLSASGFADDEIHKWLAAQRYLHFSLGGDDVEHPPLMKALIALGALLLPRSVAPETLTRLPNVLAAAICIGVLAQLGRRLFDRTTGLVAAAVYAVAPTAVGYARIAKEDTLLTLFLLLLLCFLEEARMAADAGQARASHRWELAGAAALAGMMLSKYMPFLVGIPLLAYAWIRRSGTAWKVSPRRWGGLALVALGIFVAADWPLFLPSSWSYLWHYILGDAVGDRASGESLLFMGRLYNNLALHYRGGTPAWFHLVFAGVKLSPPVVALMAGGLGIALVRRSIPHRILLVWIGFFFLCFTVFSGKYGRYFIPVLPACLLLAAHAAVVLGRRLSALGGDRAAAAATLALAALMVGDEAWNALRLVPHDRLYISALAGGDAAVDYFFPHCDYFDSGAREAFGWIAAHAPPGAEVATEIEWVAGYYFSQARRPDLVVEPVLPKYACRLGRACYVVAQTGRLYWHNQVALEALAQRAPAEQIQVGGHTAVRVYRLDPGSRPFDRLTARTDTPARAP